MMYTPTTWNNGDIITEQKLNKLEQGLEDAGCKIAVVTVTVTIDGNDTTYTPDKTLAEVMALIEDGYIPVYKMGNSAGYAVAVPTTVFPNSEDEEYGISVTMSGDEFAHYTTGFVPLTGPVS